MAIRRLDLRSLPNDKHLGAAGQICDIIVSFDFPNFPLFATRKTAMIECRDAEDAAYTRTVKDFNSDDMKTHDNYRDSYMSAARGILNGWALLPDIEPQKRMALQMLQVYKDYKFSTSDSYTGESVKIENMWQVFETKETVLRELGVWEILEKAVDENDAVKSYFSNRINELATRVIGELRDARTATDDAYRSFCEVLDAILVLAPSADASTLESRLNALTDYYKQYYLKGGSSSSSSSNSGNSSSGTTPGSDDNGGGEPTPDPSDQGGGDNGGGEPTPDPSNEGGGDSGGGNNGGGDNGGDDNGGLSEG